MRIILNTRRRSIRRGRLAEMQSLLEKKGKDDVRWGLSMKIIDGRLWREGCGGRNLQRLVQRGLVR